MDVIVRNAKAEDFEAVYPLFGQLWPGRPLDRAELHNVFCRGAASDNDVLFCLEADGNVAGFCAYAIVNSLWLEGYIAYIYAMVIDEKNRGKGWGSRLISEAIGDAKKRGMKRVELDSGFPRERAHQFYLNLGFEKRGYLFSYSFKE